MKTSLLILMFSIFTFFYFQSNNGAQRFPASFDHSNIEFIKWQYNSRMSFAVLGLKNHSAENAFDFNDIRYPVEFQTSNDMIPKYLFTFVDGRIKEVFAFELKSKFGKSYKALESNDIPRYYVKIDPEAKYFPRKISDIEMAQKHAIKKTIFKLANTATYFTQFAPLGILINRLFSIDEEKESYQAFYLERLIRLSLFEDRLPTLKSSIGEENLWEIGAALNLTYHSDAEYAAFFTDRKKRIELYKKYRNLKEDQYFVNMSKLVQRCNEEGLMAIPITSDFAMVYAFNDQDYYKEFNSFILNLNNPSNLISKVSEFNYDSSKLIPLGIFSTRESRTPLPLVEFSDVGDNAKKNDIYNLLNDAKEIGYSFISYSGLNIALKGIDGILHFVNIKSGTTIFEHRIYSDAEFDLILDSGIFNLAKEDILEQVIDYQLKSIHVDEDERIKILSALKSEDLEVQNQTMTAIVKKFKNKEKDEEFLDLEKPIDLDINRFKNWKAFTQVIEDKRIMQKHYESLLKKSQEYERYPANDNDSKLSKPVVLFLMDGLRPDRLKQAMKKGLVPNIQKYFGESGVEFDSYTARSLTLPSWGTILTGYTPDQHGVRSNTPIRRKSAKAKDNYTDIRKDLVSIYKNDMNRSLIHLKESGKKWLADYYAKDETIMNYMPYSNGLNIPFKNLGTNVLNNLSDLFYGSFNGALALDLSSLDATIEAVQNNPGKFKLIMNWLASVDVHSHHNNESLDYIYVELDKKIGELIGTLKNDPVMKNAHLFLVSDHGMRGGKETAESQYKLTVDGELLKNTGFNLTTYFAGDYFSHRQYSFVVKTFESPTPNHDLHFLSEFQIHPFEYIYRGKRNNQGGVNILIDTSGDALTQLYFKSPNSDDWKKRPSLYELQNYKMNGNSLNIIEDLLNVKLNSIATADPKLRMALYRSSAFRPVEFIGTWIKNDISIETLKEKFRIDEKLSREPVVIFHKDGQALIFTKRNIAGEEVYRYIPIKNFRQFEDGKTHFELAHRNEDILSYGKQMGFEYSQWYSDRQLLNMFSKSNYPTAIYGLVKLLTLDRNLQNNEYRQSERPDIVAIARPGFNFNSSYITEGDHGGFEKVQVKNAVFVSKLGQKDVTLKPSSNPVMAKDILPTILKINGIEEKSSLWDNMWRTLF